MAEERGFLYNARQSLGSFFDLALSNPDRVSPPGVVSGAYSGLDFLLNAVTKPMERFGGVEGGLNLPGAERMTEDFAATQEMTNQILGIDNPQTTVEAANRFGSSFALPLGSVSNILRAPEGANRVQRLLSTTGRGAIAATVPGSQATTPLGRAVEAGVQVGAPTALFAATADVAQAQPDYSDIFGDTEYEIVRPTSQENLQEGSPLADLFPSDAEIVQSEIDTVVNEEQDDNTKWWTVGLVAGALMGGGYVAARRLSRARSPRGGQFSQQGQPLPVQTTLPDQAETAIFNRGAALQRQLTPEDVARFDVGANDSAIAQRTMHFARTGEFPVRTPDIDNEGTVLRNGEVKLNFPPESHFARAAQLTDDEFATLDDALQAYDEINSRRISVNSAREGTASNLDQAISPRFADVGMPGLQRIVSNARGNPRIKQMMDEYHHMTDKFRDYLRSRGMITQNEWKFLKDHRPGFVPQYANEPKGIWRRIRDGLVSTTDKKNIGEAEELLARSLEPGGGVPNALNSYDAMSRYMMSILRNVEYNDIRARSFKELEAKGLARAVDGQTRDALEFRDQGTRKFFEVEDPHIRQALEFNPHMALPVFNAARRAFQFMTTGPGNPFFAPTAFTYDAMILPFAAPEGRAVGLLPAKVAKYVPDITAPLYAVGGIGRGLYGNFTMAADAALTRSLDNNTMVAQVLGPQATKALRDRMSQAHARSTLSFFNRYGGGASPYVGTEDFTGGRFVLGEVVPEYRNMPVALQRFYNGYRMVIDSIHNGGRLAFVARNMTDDMSDEEIIKLMADTRKLTAGDFARSGSGQGLVGGTVQATASISPYFNIMLQATHNFVRLTRISPIRTAAYFGTLGAGVFWAYQRAAEMGPQYLNYVMNEASPEDRTNRIPIVLPGKPPEDTYWLPVEPLFTVFTAPLIAAMDSLMGYSTGDYYLENNTFRDAANNLLQPDTWDDDLVTNVQSEALRGASRAFAPDPGPIFGSVAAMAGYDIRTDYSGAVEGGGPLREIRETPNQFKTGDPVLDVILAQQFQQITEEFIGASTNLAFLTYTAVDDAARSVWSGEEASITRPYRDEFLARTTEQYSRQAQPIPALLGMQSSDRLTTNNAVAREVRDYRDALRKNNQFFGDIMVSQGTLTSQSDQRTRMPGLPPGLLQLTSPLNRQIVNQMRSFFRGRERAYQGRINSTYDLIFSTDHRTDLAHDERISTRNDLVRQLNDIREEYLWDIKEFERQISEQYGIDFDVREFDPTQPVTP